jgi:hypothetical protein
MLFFYTTQSIVLFPRKSTSCLSPKSNKAKDWDTKPVQVRFPSYLVLLTVSGGNCVDKSKKKDWKLSKDWWLVGLGKI